MFVPFRLLTVPALWLLFRLIGFCLISFLLISTLSSGLLFLSFLPSCSSTNVFHSIVFSPLSPLFFSVSWATAPSLSSTSFLLFQFHPVVSFLVHHNPRPYPPFIFSRFSTPVHLFFVPSSLSSALNLHPKTGERRCNLPPFSHTLFLGSGIQM